MSLIAILLTIIVPLALTVAFWYFVARRMFRSTRALIQFNTTGGLMDRLVPNIAFTVLFLMLLKLCWF